MQAALPLPPTDHALAGQVANAPAGGVYSAGIIAVILIAIVAWAIYKERNPW